MRNMKAGLAMFESKVDILMSFIFEVVLIDFLKKLSFIYVHFKLEYVLICYNNQLKITCHLKNYTPQWVEILVFPSPTGYIMLTSFGFSWRCII